jgi:hypothetical protein
MPPLAASGTNTTARATDTRFDIVMVKRSDTAAKIIRAGKNRTVAA